MYFTYEHIEKLKYMDAFIKEGLRIYTPTPI